MNSDSQNNCLFKEMIVGGWCLFVLNELLFHLHILTDETHSDFLICNELCVKGIFFTLYYLIQSIKKRGISLTEIQQLHRINYAFKAGNSPLSRLIYGCINHIIYDPSVIRQSKYAMSEQVYSRRFSHDFVNTILCKTSVDVYNVYILFSDIVQYSTMCRDHSSREMFNTLHSLYNMYDRALLQFPNLQKIECIGDCYFISSLLDNPYNHDASTDIIAFAHTIIKCAKECGVSVRVGVHYGDVSVGILGTELPRFSVVGNAVNITARLESTCPVYGIHVSDILYNRLNNETLKAEKRNVYLKNIGPMTTYWIQP